MPALRDLRIAVVIPTLNEQESIGAVVAEIPRDFVARVIVADGGSADRTVEAARAAGAETLDAGRGYGRACLTGAHAASDCDLIVFMDGDGADDPAMIAGLVDPLRRGTQDFVIGSRTRGEREPGAMAWTQVVAGRLFGLGVRARYGVGYTDMCAQRAIRRDVLLGLGMSELGYGWNLEMQMLAAREGLRVLELPVPCRRRIGGQSKVAGSFKGAVTAGSRIVATFVTVARRGRAATSLTRGAAGR
ncbi:glycosyltransferase family 2 protein [Hansschlegelia sp. KR7-227]|uniref:glycosyltransferase family 2 protein n=1 Tax=Hansschlegelia sp. KR7-227 TaxID=3400914 RepID=UPI003C126DED